MATVEKISNGIILECDCGAIHKVYQKEKKIFVKSTYQKKEKEKNYEKKEPEPESESGSESEPESESDGIFF